MSDAMPPIVEDCPSCSQPIDVTDQPPFSQVACPSCGQTMRARIQFNNFTLLELIGEGGMGSVFKAMDRNLQRKVALKILKRDAGSTEVDWEKLASEARLTAAVNHPSVVKVFSFGEDHGQFYLAMELVEKGSLDSLMVLQTKVAEVQVLELGIQAAEGLRAAYEVGLIHRDIKPGNILFATPRLAKLVDFGLARVLDEESQESGEIWGTPFYVAPEKLDGRPEDFRSDIYSLGGTLFHALAGRPPFDARTASMVVLKHIKSQAVSLQAFAPNISDETAYVINRMLHKDPDQRYPSYDELLTHLNYARQRLQKKTSGVKTVAGKKAKPVVAIAGNRVALASLWAVAAALAIAAVVGVFRVAGSEAKDRPAAATAVSSADALLVQGRLDLNARRFEDASAKFASAAEAASNPATKNWALAQLGLSFLLLGDEDKAREAFLPLERGGIFDASLSGQSLGRFFTGLGRQLSAAPPVSADEIAVDADSNCGSFGLLAIGLRDWLAGDVLAGGALLGGFERAAPGPPDRWIEDLRPLAAPYLAEYRRYEELAARIKRSSPSNAVDLLASIEKAKAEVKTGPQMTAALDELAAKLR